MNGITATNGGDLLKGLLNNSNGSFFLNLHLLFEKNKMTGLLDLPRDVIWLILRECLNTVSKDFYGSSCPNAIDESDQFPFLIFADQSDMVKHGILPLIKIHPSFKRLLQTKCEWDLKDSDWWGFIKGAFD